MTLRDRLLSVLRRQTPDAVPWFADLSHWQAAMTGRRFLPIADDSRTQGMLELHREVGAGAYLNFGSFHTVAYEGAVEEKIEVKGDRFGWTLKTAVGAVSEERMWRDQSFSWDITKRMVGSVADLKVVRYAMERRRFAPCFERFRHWDAACGDLGLPFAPTAYSGLGFLVSRFMGVEQTVYALHDAAAEVEATIHTINETNLQLIDLLTTSPAPVIFHSDNLSSDIQSPRLFQEFSAEFYREMARRVHAVGKWLSVHIDGRLGGLLPCLRQCDVDCADAVTPAPMGDLTPEQCRAEAGPDLILWGGIPPTTFSSETDDDEFEAVVRRWLDLRHQSHRLVLAPGDQVPPHTAKARVQRVADMVEEQGQY